MRIHVIFKKYFESYSVTVFILGVWVVKNGDLNLVNVVNIESSLVLNFQKLLKKFGKTKKK